MSISFPYYKTLIDGSEVIYPYIIASLHSSKGIRSYSFLVDTGADTMLMPFYMTHLMQIPKKSLTVTESIGINNKTIRSYEADITIQIGTLWITIPCTFINDTLAPYLLGRKGVFNYFSILFDNKKKETVLTKI